MKIIEKKCPNCGANLEYKVGERDVKCSSCRRAYAVEYDHDIPDPEVQLKAKDIQLKILEDFEKGRKASKILMPIFLTIFAIAFIVSLIVIIGGAINIHNKREEMDEEYERSRQQSEQQYQEQTEAQREMQEKILQQIEENSGVDF